MRFVLLPARKYSFRTKFCKYYKKGYCRYGKKCQFIHGLVTSRKCQLEELAALLKSEMEKKFEELHTVISSQTLEILDLKKCLSDLMTQPLSSKTQAHPSDNQACTLMNSESQTNILDT